MRFVLPAILVAIIACPSNGHTPNILDWPTVAEMREGKVKHIPVDPALIEKGMVPADAVRGPRGYPGPRGEAGPKGEPGPPGPSGAGRYQISDGAIIDTQTGEFIAVRIKQPGGHFCWTRPNDPKFPSHLPTHAETAPPRAAFIPPPIDGDSGVEADKPVNNKERRRNKRKPKVFRI